MSPTYRSRIVGRVKRDYSTRREIAAAVARASRALFRPIDRILLSSLARLLCRFLLAFSRAVRETGLAGSLLNGGQFHSEDWWPMARKLTRENNTRSLRDSSRNQSVGYSGWEVREPASHPMFISQVLRSERTQQHLSILTKCSFFRAPGPLRCPRFASTNRPMIFFTGLILHFTRHKTGRDYRPSEFYLDRTRIFVTVSFLNLQLIKYI